MGIWLISGKMMLSNLYFLIQGLTGAVFSDCQTDCMALPLFSFSS
jgi:hypothetical protein